MIMIQNYLLLFYIYVIYKTFFIPICHIYAVQADIFTITVPIWLHYTLYEQCDAITFTLTFFFRIMITEPILSFHIFDLKCCLHPQMLFNSHDVTSKTVLICLYIVHCTERNKFLSKPIYRFSYKKEIFLKCVEKKKSRSDKCHILKCFMC